MPEGTIKTKTAKGFGFITAGSGEDIFFHRSGVEGVSFDDLKEGDACRTPLARGLRAREPGASEIRSERPMVWSCGMRAVSRYGTVLEIGQSVVQEYNGVLKSCSLVLSGENINDPTVSRQRISR